MINKIILEKLKYFKQAYKDKDLGSYDKFSSYLFGDGQVKIIGTSFEEFCLNNDEVKELFLGDWEYWGNLDVNLDNLVSKELDDLTILYSDSTVEINFVRDEETYRRYYDSIENIKDTDDLKTKLFSANWIYSHFLHEREGDKRDYLFDVGITFIFTKRSDDYFITEMVFSMPSTAEYPDVRLEHGGWEIEDYEKELAVFRDLDRSRDDLLIPLKRYLNDETSITEETLTINAMNKSGNVLKQFPLAESKKFDVIMNKKGYVNYSNDKYEIVMGLGLYKSKFTEDELLKYTKYSIDKHKESTDDYKELIFTSRRHISALSKELSYGEDFTIPFRYLSVFNKSNKSLEFLQTSLHYTMILEGKNSSQNLKKVEYNNRQ